MEKAISGGGLTTGSHRRPLGEHIGGQLLNKVITQPKISLFFIFPQMFCYLNKNPQDVFMECFSTYMCIKYLLVLQHWQVLYEHI